MLDLFYVAIFVVSAISACIYLIYYYKKQNTVGISKEKHIVIFWLLLAPFIFIILSIIYLLFTLGGMGKYLL